MIKIIVAIVGLMGFTTINELPIDKIDQLSVEQYAYIEQMTHVIQQKLAKAEELEAQAATLTSSNADATQAKALLEEAKMERMIVLKYKAGIACRLLDK